MLSSTVKFADDSAALEKTLRFLQYAMTIGAGLAVSAEVAAKCLQAQTLFNLARRYFRFLKWHPCWTVAYKSLHREEATGLEKLLEVAKWSFLGLYFFLEMPTLRTNAMGVTNYEWGPALQREANKCWLYAIAASILLSLYQLTTLPNATPVKRDTQNENMGNARTEEKRSKRADSEVSTNSARSKLYAQLLIDCCDFLIPSAALGWVRTDHLTVGIAGSVSSAVAGRQIWQRVQQSV